VLEKLQCLLARILDSGLFEQGPGFLKKLR